MQEHLELLLLKFYEWSYCAQDMPIGKTEKHDLEDEFHVVVHLIGPLSNSVSPASIRDANDAVLSRSSKSRSDVREMGLVFI